MSKQPAFPSEVAVQRALATLLEGHYPPPSGVLAHVADGQRAFARRHDDTDGARGPEQHLEVALAPDGDVWILSPHSPEQSSLRFRTDAGGGMSPRVHRALLILAEAIRRDNTERPQP